MDLQSKIGMALDDIPSAARGGGGGGGGGKAPRISGNKAPRSNSGRGNNRHNPIATKGSKPVGTRVYVGNLDWSVAWQDLKDLCNTVGTVRHADVLLLPDGKSKGCGIVEFATVADAKRAIEQLNDHELNGRPIFLREDREAPGVGSFRGGAQPRAGGFGGGGGAGGAGGAAVYVGNLSFDTTWQDLKDAMRKAGGVAHADVPKRPDGRSKGFGLVVFENANAARRACEQLNGTDLDGREIVVRLDKQASGGSGGANGGYGSGASYLQHGGHGGHGQDGNRKVYVGGVSFDTTWQTLKDFMRQAGNVVHADIPQRPDGRSKGFGLVEYENAKSAHWACQQLNGAQLEGRTLSVRPDVGAGLGTPGGRGGGGGDATGRRVYIGNIPYSLRWQDLKDYLRDAGFDVTHTEVPMLPGSDKIRGFALAEFSSAAEANRAMDHLNERDIEGRQVFCKIDER